MASTFLLIREVSIGLMKVEFMPCLYNVRQNLRFLCLPQRTKVMTVIIYTQGEVF